MNQDKTLCFLIISLLLFLPGCDIILGIFAAGFWTAVILVIILIAVISWGVYKYRERD